MSQILTSTLTLVGVLVMMLSISPLLTAVALITVPLSLVVMKQIASRARPRFLDQWRLTGSVNAQDEEAFTGPVVVKTYGRQRRSEEHTSELQSLMRNSYAVFCLKTKKK